MGHHVPTFGWLSSGLVLLGPCWAVPAEGPLLGLQTGSQREQARGPAFIFKDRYFFFSDPRNLSGPFVPTLLKCLLLEAGSSAPSFLFIILKNWQNVMGNRERAHFVFTGRTFYLTDLGMDKIGMNYWESLPESDSNRKTKILSVLSPNFWSLWGLWKITILCLLWTAWQMESKCVIQRVWVVVVGVFHAALLQF